MHNKKKIYILMTQTGTRFSKLLKLQSKHPYNHVSIALDRDLTQLYSFGRKHIYFPLFAGFIQEDISGGLYALYHNTDCLLYEMNVSEKEYDNICSIIESFQEEEKHYRYNLLGLITILCGIPVERRYHFVCSQFVAYVLEKSNVTKLPKSHTMITPQDFEYIGQKRRIYQGKLLEYPRISKVI